MKILASIARVAEEDRLEQSEQREQLRRDALHMLKEFQEQMRIEKEKEQELDAMFQSVELRSLSTNSSRPLKQILEFIVF